MAEQEHETQSCFLYRTCPYKTAVCNVRKPDEGCYVYREFKKIIKNQEERT